MWPMSSKSIKHEVYLLSCAVMILQDGSWFWWNVCTFFHRKDKTFHQRLSYSECFVTTYNFLTDVSQQKIGCYITLILIIQNDCARTHTILVVVYSVTILVLADNNVVL